MAHEQNILESLYAQTLGAEVLAWARAYAPPLLAEKVDLAAVTLIQEIQTLLNDDTLDDPECFYRIEAVVNAFHRAGIPTARHDW